MESTAATQPPPALPEPPRLGNFRLFIFISVATFFLVLSYIFLTRLKAADRPPLTRVNQNIFITSQLTLRSPRFLRTQRIRTLVDVRPDGEAPDQPSSALIAEAARAHGVAFHFIPVPHETIPDQAVDSLAQVLATADAPTLLYCRTGRRAVRLLALAEATRSDGPDVEDIIKLVRSAGFEGDDLRERLQHRFAERGRSKAKQ
ncbi:MAG: TIGR01244 family phosphatase [Proteobacteria bacterium]|nr:TIGR01244 family phosphatase [Pseudomonadota bacterium]